MLRRERERPARGSPPSPARSTPSCPPARRSCCSGGTTPQLRGRRPAGLRAGLVRPDRDARRGAAAGSRRPAGSRIPSDTFDPAHRPAGRGHAAALERSRSRAQLRPWDPDGRRSSCTRTSSTRATGRRAAPSAATPRARDEVPLTLTRRHEHRRRAGARGDVLLLARAARARSGRWCTTTTAPARSVPGVRLVVSRRHDGRASSTSTRSRSYDLHYTAEADEEGAVWLRFGDGVNGREIALRRRRAAERRRAALPDRRPGRRQRRARHARRDRPPGHGHRRAGGARRARRRSR